MLQIHFHAETPKDNISAITVANGLIENGSLTPAELEEIAGHLLAYVKCLRTKENVYHLEPFKKENK